MTSALFPSNRTVNKYFVARRNEARGARQGVKDNVETGYEGVGGG